MPEGADDSQIAANSDSDVLVVLDLHLDTSMIEQGLSRQVVNRYQKLRKKAGLTVTDSVEFYYDISGRDVDPLFEKALQSQREYLKTSLGSVLMPLSAKPYAAAVLFKEDQVMKMDDGEIRFMALITPLTVTPERSAFEDEQTFVRAAACLANRDRTKLISEVKASGLPSPLETLPHNF